MKAQFKCDGQVHIHCTCMHSALQLEKGIEDRQITHNKQNIIYNSLIGLEIYSFIFSNGLENSISPTSSVASFAAPGVVSCCYGCCSGGLGGGSSGAGAELLLLGAEGRAKGREGEGECWVKMMVVRQWFRCIHVYIAT